jgi:hypothetical protein
LVAAERDHAHELSWSASAIVCDMYPMCLSACSTQKAARSVANKLENPAAPTKAELRVLPVHAASGFHPDRSIERFTVITDIFSAIESPETRNDASKPSSLYNG